MDVRYINPFIKSIKSVFETMLSTGITFDKPFATIPHNNKPEVSAIIGFSGDASGSVVLAFQTSTAERTASRFAGMELKLEHPDFGDAIGELANMVAGGAKSQFDGFDINLSLPSVIIGKELEISVSRLHPGLAIPCRSALGEFNVYVAMQVEKNVAQGVSV